MKSITLNIGLSVSRNYLPEGVADMQLQAEYVKDYLQRAFGRPMQIHLAQSTTEKTVVVQYSNVELVVSKLFLIAHDLSQDCIAYRVQAGDNVLGGALVGKYAYEWNFGIFNEEYFIESPFKTELNLELNLELTLN